MPFILGGLQQYSHNHQILIAVPMGFFRWQIIHR